MLVNHGYSATDRLSHVEEDKLELDDSSLNQPFTSYSLYGVNKKGDIVRLGVHADAAHAVAQVTHNEGMNWIRLYTSLVVMEEYMREGDLMQKPVHRWNLGFIML